MIINNNMIIRYLWLMVLSPAIGRYIQHEVGAIIRPGSSYRQSCRTLYRSLTSLAVCRFSFWRLLQHLEKKVAKLLSSVVSGHVSSPPPSPLTSFDGCLQTKSQQSVDTNLNKVTLERDKSLGDRLFVMTSLCRFDVWQADIKQNVSTDSHL